MTEAAFQQAIVETLTLQLRGCVIAAVPNEVHETGRRAKAEVSKKKARGLCPGFPDLIVIWGLGCYLIEVKTPKGRLSENQKAVHARLKENGVAVFVIRNHKELDEAIRLIKERRGMTPEQKYKEAVLWRAAMPFEKYEGNDKTL